MNQEQADRIEGLLMKLTNEIEDFKIELIREFSELKSVLREDALNNDRSSEIQNLMKEALRQMRQENNERHSEIIARFEILEANQEHTWEKTVINGRDIAVMKKLAK
ncbi:hypothetical protein [Metabacillus sp. cB07]|uniref:hypothetical protein n=1 Tax=Metabacillus sp. cB07 TaxID=2806989 RepID=UPI00193982F4|nr:hypothetical protein [Metabacillus sp. cB07]